MRVTRNGSHGVEDGRRGEVVGGGVWWQLVPRVEYELWWVVALRRRCAKGGGVWWAVVAAVLVVVPY